MFRLRPFPIFVTLFALLISGCAAKDARDEGPVVLAPISLQEALGEVAAQWLANGQAPVTLSFAGTPALTRQIEAGAPADLAITADAQWMDWLEERALVRQATRIDLLSNSLVWIAQTQVDAAIPIAERAALLGRDRIALADPQSVPAGRYARTALVQMGLWDGLAPHVVGAENVRSALALVERGEARYGIVYATDQIASDQVQFAGVIPAEFGEAIIYPAALVTHSKNADTAAFLAYLSGPQASQIFREHGFVVDAD